MGGPQERHGIRIPGEVLDRIRSKEESGEYKDSRFGFKRKAPQKLLSRKEKRKELRRVKKQKVSHASRNQTISKPQSREDRPKAPPKPSQNQDPEDPLALLKALKAKKNASSADTKVSKPSKAEEDLRVVRPEDLDDELGSDDFDSLSDNSSQDEYDTETSIGENHEDPLEALRKLKEAKNKKPEEKAPDSESDDALETWSISEQSELESAEDLDEDPLAKLKKIKEAKKKAVDASSKQPKTIEATFTDPLDNDMEFYAKKLGLKNGKKARLTKEDPDDLLGGLLDGLEFDFEKSDESELSENESDGFADDASDDDNSDSATETMRENPFVAPSTSHTLELANTTAGEAGKYVPPALRRKLASADLGLTPEQVALQRAIKGPINKLSESNVGLIVNEINGLYLSNPRQAVNETLTSIILDSVVHQGRLLESFVFLQSALAAAIYKLRGVDFGAYFVQTLVESFDTYNSDPSKLKEALNVMSLLSSVYAFQLVSARLLYDLIKDLLGNLNESNAEILIKIVRNSGNQMRSDDPMALKEIVLQVNQRSSAMGSELTPRMQFLLETISSLKNNKLKLNNEASHQLQIRLKKFLGTIASGKLADPIQVSLSDIRHADTKGKWWLVGSAWKGADEEEASAELGNKQAMNDILDNAEPNWLELARVQRMNTDIRRAIFISIMSANDYVDALTKLDKLALKKAQEREIPRIVIHCAVVEPAWNPYYGILATKLCDTHSYRKTFQFMLWDILRGFDGIDGDELDEESAFTGFDDSVSDEDKLKRILNLGRLFGNLFAQGSLPLHVLRTVNFITMSTDTKLLMEVLFITFLDQIAKKSQINAMGAGLVSSRRSMSEQKFDDRTLIERILKAKDEPALLKGIEHFVSRKVLGSDFLVGKKQRKRVAWGIESMKDVIGEITREVDF